MRNGSLSSHLWIAGYLCITLCITACASGEVGSELPRGAMAYDVIPVAPQDKPPVDYRIGPLDGLDINVLQEPELSSKATLVDAFGNVNLPLIGEVKASGKTAAELSRELAARFGEKYLERPQVSVVVSKPVPQKVAVQGEVIQPGIYEIQGPTTLLGALSLAKGEAPAAKLNEVVVFRTVNGQRTGAVFDVTSIRNGQSEDPEIVSNDMVVVGFSAAKRTWRDVIASIPIMGIFRPF